MSLLLFYRAGAEVTGIQPNDDFWFRPTGGYPSKRDRKVEPEPEESEPAVILESIETPNLPPDIPVVRYPDLDLTPVIESKRKARKAALRKRREDLEADDEDIFLLL